MAVFITVFLAIHEWGFRRLGYWNGARNLHHKQFDRHIASTKHSLFCI